MRTLLEFATDKLILSLLIKERVKCSGKYKRRVKKWAQTGKKAQSNIIPQTELDTELPKLDFLTSIFPSRNSWVRPSKRKVFQRPDGTQELRKQNAQALKSTIKRDRRTQDTLNSISQKRVLSPVESKLLEKLKYLERLDQYVKSIRDEIGGSGTLSFSTPLLRALYKNEKRTDDGTVVVTYRPLSMYVELHDKIILAIVSKYLTSMFNWYLHPNILSYRSARNFLDRKHHVTDFNDGVKMIRRYRECHQEQSIFVADCDIKKFYDTINHEVVRDCFSRMLQAADLGDEGRNQVMRILDAYLHSYNFYEQVLLKSQTDNFWKMVKAKRAPKAKEVYRFDWVGEEEFVKCYGDRQTFLQQRNQIGVPQGGSLSLMIANVVLNDVDKMTFGDELPQTTDAEDERQDLLFIRFCDDMVLMHTEEKWCKFLIDNYCKSLSAHKLIYHPFTLVADVKHGNSTSSDFWNVKSHDCFCWQKGKANASAWVGFLGYEMHCDGSVRLRKSNVQKILDKITKQRYVMRRLLLKQDLTFEKLKAEIDRHQNTLVKSLNVYTELKPNNAHIRRQLLRLNQQRKRMLRYLSCRSAHTCCQFDQGQTAADLRAFFRSYLRENHGF